MLYAYTKSDKADVIWGRIEASVNGEKESSLLSGMYVSRKVYINGEILFEEAKNCRFPYADSWSTMYLSDGSGVPFEFYFEAGKDYTIRLEVSLGEMAEIVIPPICLTKLPLGFIDALRLI